MEPPTFTQDLFDTYQSLPPYLQVLWLVVPPIFTTVMFSLWLRYRLSRAEITPAPISPVPQPYFIRNEGFECYVVSEPVHTNTQPLIPMSEKNTSDDAR